MMTITYAAGAAIYVNMTNRCPCACTFCLRHNKDHVFDSNSLWLDREPTVKEVCDSLDAWNLEQYKEIVFCGYGEPTERLYDLLDVAKYIRGKSEIKIRINTNGHSDLILGRDTAPEYEGAFDIVSISLNAPDDQKYQQICHPIFGEEILDVIFSFAVRVKNYVPTVQFSVVKESLTPEEIALCQQISQALGVTLRLRDYIPPES